MPVEPIPCGDGGSTPVEVTTCCSPSIASAPLCRADGATVLLVVRSGCIECGEVALDPVAVGWIDAASGAFTAGALPADAGPCDAGCVDMVCRQLCDDADGDGQADTTYSELWCIRTDGSAQLVLTYRDDPSTPYVPLAPVECNYGCPEAETVTLCDDGGTFLRRYTFLNGTATYEDVALDGQTPHVVTGTVGACTGTGGAGDACCSPSIASSPLCRPDGSTVLLVVRSGCVECGEAAQDPAVVGWLDAATGAYTAGPAPADAGACSAGCVDTVCRTRCDDTDGDGAPDVMYSELWCVRADGSAELVLTYQDDPSAPYLPVSPVECTYGAVSTATVPLCDDGGPFLRRYTFLDGTGTYEDTELDGQTPHVVTGPPGPCAGEAGTPCAEQTTPTATLGLCLADGTPIAVLLTRDCAGLVTQDGWVNLTTGAFSAGAPPAGAQACGDSRAFELAGLLCDVDPGTGDVFAPVLVEYEYNPDGSLASVRLVAPGTGSTYVLQGELNVCPSGTAAAVADQDLTVLCDVQADGTALPFLRDYLRNPGTGLIAGFTDYGLDGTAYAPTGTVNRCAEDSVTCTGEILCDTTGEDFDAAAMGSASGAMANGLTWSVTAGAAMPTQAYWVMNSSAPQVWTFSEVAAVAWSARMGFFGACIVMPVGTVPVSIHAGHSYDPATRTLCRVTSGGADESSFSHPGAAVLTFVQAGAGATLARQIGLVSASPLASVEEFQRTICRSGDGTVVSVTDTALDGVTPYIPAGTVGQCQTGGGECCDPVVPETRLDVETALMCMTDEASGNVLGQVLAELLYDDQSGERTALRLTDPTTGDAVVLPAGAVLSACSTPTPPCEVNHVLEACRCDDTDGDGVADTDYVELIGVDCDGILTPLGTYTPDLSAPYAPVAPVDCAEAGGGAEETTGVQARRVQLDPGGTWDAAAWPTLQSVSAVAQGGTGTITTADGNSTLHTGESATWSVTKDIDALLTGPLAIAADTGTVTITFTTGVTL